MSSFQLKPLIWDRFAQRLLSLLCFRCLGHDWNKGRIFACQLHKGRIHPIQLHLFVGVSYFLDFVFRSVLLSHQATPPSSSLISYNGQRCICSQNIWFSGKWTLPHAVTIPITFETVNVIFKCKYYRYAIKSNIHIALHPFLSCIGTRKIYVSIICLSTTTF